MSCKGRFAWLVFFFFGFDSQGWRGGGFSSSRVEMMGGSSMGLKGNGFRGLNEYMYLRKRKYRRLKKKKTKKNKLTFSPAIR